jgi:hypothetical protein
MTTAAYVGSMDYEPNVAAARLLLERWPAIQAASGLERLLLMGRRAAAHFTGEGQRRGAVGRPPTCARRWRRRRAGRPLVSGGGVRVKIIEAFALGLPVVSTRLGIEGLGATDGVHAVVVDDVEGLAGGLARMREHAVRRALADNGRRLWESTYSPRAYG